MVLRVNLIPAKSQPSGLSDEVWRDIQKQKRVNNIPMIDAKFAMKNSRGGWQLEGKKLDTARVNLDLNAMDDRGLKITALGLGINLGGANKKSLSRKKVIELIEAKMAAVDFSPDDE